MLNQSGHARHQTFIKARDEVGWIVFQITNVDPNLDHRSIVPHIGATEMLDAQNLNGFIE
jgi:hypothetical protein